MACGSLADESNPANGLVTFHTRTFDLRTDAAKLMRNPDTIVLDDIKWLGPILEADPVLYDTVFHIRDGRVPSDWLWHAPGPGMAYKYNTEIPDQFRLPGYETWSSSPNSTVDFLLLPTRGPRDYSVTCGTDRKSNRLLLCVVVASYPPDPHIFLKARVYFPNPLAETSKRFGSIAERMREIAYCLDVTDGSKVFGIGNDGLAILANCKNEIGM